MAIVSTETLQNGIHDNLIGEPGTNQNSPWNRSIIHPAGVSIGEFLRGNSGRRAYKFRNSYKNRNRNKFDIDWRWTSNDNFQLSPSSNWMIPPHRRMAQNMNVPRKPPSTSDNGFLSARMRPRCCYCGQVDQRYNMIAVPTTTEKREEWEKVFGLVFTIRCNSLESPYVCKTHIDTNGTETVPVANMNLVYIDPDLSDHVYFKFFAQEEIEKEYGKDEIIIKEEMPDIKEEVLDEEIEAQRPSCSFQSYEVPNEDVMRYYLVLTDDSIIDCGFCYQTFTRNTVSTTSLKEHLMIHHADEIREIMRKENENDYDGSGKSDNRFSKNLNKLTTEQEDYADSLLLKFIVNNGISFSTIEDRNFQKLIFNLNPCYQAPTSEGMRILAKEIVKKKTKSTIGKHGPISITVDLCKQDERTFLAFSVTHFSTQGLHRTDKSIFFRELPEDVTKTDVPVILRTIQSAIDEKDCTQSSFTNIITSDPELEEKFTNADCSKNVFLCFFSHITNFANALLNLPIFKDGLVRMRTFIKTFPIDRQQWSKFKCFLVKRRTVCEFPELDNGGWVTTIDFLMKCLQMHRVFSDFMTLHKKAGYIKSDDHTNLVYLHTIFTTIKNTIAKLASSSATISHVIPAILEIRKSIELTTSCGPLFSTVYRVFYTHLNPFVDSHDLYRFAVFLDPSQVFNQMYTDNGWRDVKRNLCTYLSFQTSGKSLISTYGGSLFKEAAMIEREVEAYCSTVRASHNRLPDASLLWWEGRGEELPRLYSLAREILAIPMFTIDAAQYFGETGKLMKTLNDLENDEQLLMLNLAGELADFESRGSIQNSVQQLHKKKINYILESESTSDKNEFMKKKMAGMSSRMMFTGYGKGAAESGIRDSVVEKYSTLQPFRYSTGAVNILPSAIKQISPELDAQLMNVEEVTKVVKEEIVEKEIKKEVEEPEAKKLKMAENNTAINNVRVHKSYTAEQNKIVTVVVENTGPAIPYPWKNTRKIVSNTNPVEQKVVKKQYFVKGATTGKFRHVSK